MNPNQPARLRPTRSWFRLQAAIPAKIGTTNVSGMTTPTGDDFPAADQETCQKDCKNEKPVMSRTLFRQIRYDSDLLLQAAPSPVQWVATAAA